MTVSKPCDDRDLEFIRNTESRRVHIVAPAGSADERTPVPRGEWGRAVFEWIMAPTPVACGKRLGCVGELVLGTGKYQRVTAFADEDLCWGCVKGLGSESHRAFEHPLEDEEVADVG